MRSDALGCDDRRIRRQHLVSSGTRSKASRDEEDVVVMLELEVESGEDENNEVGRIGEGEEEDDVSG